MSNNRTNRSVRRTGGRAAGDNLAVKLLVAGLNGIAVLLYWLWRLFDPGDIQVGLVVLGICLVAGVLLVWIFWAWIRWVAAVICVVLTIVSITRWLDFSDGKHTPAVVISAILTGLLAVEALLWAFRGPPPDVDQALELEANWVVTKGQSKRLERVMIRKQDDPGELDEATHAEMRDHVFVLSPWIILTTIWTAAFVYVVGLPQFPLLWVFVVWFAGLIPMLIRWLFWWKNTNAFTDKRIIKVYGLVGKDYPQATIRRINDVMLTVPWYSDVLTWLRIIYTQFGTLRFEIPGNVTLDYIDNIPQVYGVNRKLAEVVSGPKEHPSPETQ